MFRLARLTLVVLCVLAATAPAAVGDLAEDKAAVDARIDRLQTRIDEAKRRETVLTSDISAASERLGLVQGEVESLAATVAALDRELARHRARLEELRELYAEQTRRLTLLVRSERIAQERLERRLVELYQADPPGTVEILLSSASLDDLISQVEYLGQIARQDRRIADEVARARQELARARSATAATEAAQAEVTAVLAERTAEQRSVLSELVARRDQLAAAQADRRALLASTRAGRREAAEDLDELERASVELGDRIRAAQAGAAGGGSRATAAPSAGGLIWPVSGPITSPFGQRWGRLHAGIDVGAGFGTPIHAAAAGTVIYAGWFGGYGNLVVVDHGAGLSTAYAHQQRILVAVGAQVGQGDVLGEVGSTGHSFGPHLHFEVRVGGNPVDPLGYL